MAAAAAEVDVLMGQVYLTRPVLSSDIDGGSSGIDSSARLAREIDGGSSGVDGFRPVDEGCRPPGPGGRTWCQVSEPKGGRRGGPPEVFTALQLDGLDQRYQPGQKVNFLATQKQPRGRGPRAIHHLFTSSR